MKKEKMMNPLVSICIPTYNRSEQLQQTIETIICQEEFINGKVEIVISDNASEDDTEKIGRVYADQFENVHYYRNSENVRDLNYPLVLSRANGVLRKLNNDTFRLDPIGLKTLCHIAEKYKKEKPVIFLTNKGKTESIEEKMDFRSFVVSQGYRVTWIASFTIWEDECVGIENDIEGCSLLLWQVRKIFEIAYKKNNVIVCNEKIGTSVTPPKKDISYGLYQVFYLNYMELLKPYVDNNTINSEDVESIEKDLLYDFFTPWVIQWELNISDKKFSRTEDFKESVFQHYESKPYWKKYEKHYRKSVFKMNIKNKIKIMLGR